MSATALQFGTSRDDGTPTASQQPHTATTSKPMDPISRLSYELNAIRLMRRNIERQSAAGYKLSKDESSHLTNCSWKYNILPWSLLILMPPFGAVRGVLTMGVFVASELLSTVQCTRSFVAQPSFPLAIDTRKKLREAMPDYPLVQRFDRQFGRLYDSKQPALDIEASKTGDQQQPRKDQKQVAAASTTQVTDADRSALPAGGGSTIETTSQSSASTDQRSPAQQRRLQAANRCLDAVTDKLRDLPANTESDRSQATSSWQRIRNKAAHNEFDERYRQRLVDRDARLFRNDSSQVPVSFEFSQEQYTADFDTSKAPSEERLTLTQGKTADQQSKERTQRRNEREHRKSKHEENKYVQKRANPKFDGLVIDFSAPSKQKALAG